MNNKGQLGIGLIVTIAVALVVGLVLFQAVATNVDAGTRTNSGAVTKINQTIPVTAVNVVTELTGQELVSILHVVNRTTGEVIGAANYSLYECVRTSDNLKGICYKPLVAGQAQGVNVSYTYYPDGYIDDAGARSITGLIVILTALAIAIIAYLGIRKDYD